MKKSLLFLCSFAISALSFAQGGGNECSGIIISEYVEGWSNNKAIEIYNTSPNPIDLDPFTLVRFRNQQQTPSNPVDFAGILNPYETYVVVIDKRDSLGTGFEAPVWQELQMQADTFANPVYNDGMEAMYFNGDDAMMLLDEDQSGGLIVYDLFGKVGDTDSPDGWGAYIDAGGDPAYISQNHTLIRKQTVLEGITSNPTVFDIEAEWDSLPANTFDNLGFHLCNCDPNVGIDEIKFNSAINVFPNPAEMGYFDVSAEGFISELIVYSITGEKVYELYTRESKSQLRVETNNWNKGAYLVNVRTSNNIVSTKRIVVK